MDTLLLGGDFAPDLQGRPQTVTGLMDLLQRCMIRLTVPRGSFACDPMLGSRLRSLSRAAPEKMSEMAFTFINEALEDLPQITLGSVKCSYNPEKDIAMVEVILQIKNEGFKLEVEV